MVLANYHIDRSVAFVTNVVLCRPEDNRNPTTNEMACCAPRLQEEINNRHPKHILALGNFASTAIHGRPTKITSERIGPPKESKLYPGVKVVSAFHPAYCLRAADNFPALVTDIGKVVNDATVRWEPPKFAVFDEAAGARKALRELLDNFDEYVIDIETGIDKDTGFDHPEHYKLLCIGICYAPGRAIVIGETALQDSGVRDLCRTILQESNQLKVGTNTPVRRLIMQNGKFDLAGLKAYTGVWGHLWFDTMLASYALDERPGIHSLEFMAVELLGIPVWKNVLSKYLDKDKNFAMIPRDILYKYNAFDDCNTWALKDYFIERLEKKNVRGLHDFMCEVSDALMMAEYEGVAIDIAYLDELTNTYLDVLTEIEKPLERWVANPRSPLQVKKALAELGIRVASTNAATLEDLQNRYANHETVSEFLRLMLRHRREQKLYGTYVKGIRKRLYKGRLHPTYMLHGTTTGRQACRNPNLFNIPRENKIRKQFIPAVGNVFVQADFKTAELRVIAVESGDEYLLDLFRSPERDIHSEVALRLFGAGFNKDQRVRAKAVVFGLSYGREAFSLAQEYGWSIREAERYIREWFNLIPGAIKWQQEKIVNVVFKEHRDLVTHFGRHRRFWLITQENKKDIRKEALAFIPQSTASDICAHAYVRLRRDYGLKLRISVYDSIMAECSNNEAQEVAQLMQEVMETTAQEVYSDKVVFPVDVEVGRSWGELSASETPG